MKCKIAKVSVVLFALYAHCNSYDKLESNWKIDRDKITLSGFSSGATFSQMLQFSYSSMFSGIAVFSHTYYRCGLPNGKVDDYDKNCTKLFNLTEKEFYDIKLVREDIKNYERANLIEKTSNLEKKRLYVYAGLQNELFTLSQMLGIVWVYEKYIKSMKNIYTRVQDANLVLPTNNRAYGLPCTQFSENKLFIGQCGFSGATEALNFLLDDDYDPSEAFTTHNIATDKLLEFDQTEFTDGLKYHQMDEVGYYYRPKNCRSSSRRCYLHFYFHGCASGRQFGNKTHIEQSGYLELAERKNIIMIFPQAVRTPGPNDIGCWDTFGISGELYATQKGPQIRAVKGMLDKVLGSSRSSSAHSHTAGSNSYGGSGNYGNGLQNPKLGILLFTSLVLQTQICSI